MRAIITRAHLNAAAKGNVHAQKEVLRQARELELRDAQRAADTKAARDRVYADIEFWKKVRERDWAQARSSDQELSQPWPHPDDILLYAATQDWHVRGPTGESCLPQFMLRRAERDALFARMVVDYRRSRAKGSTVVSIGELWIAHDRLLPLRWQIAPHIDLLVPVLFALPMREMRRLAQGYWDHAMQLQTCAPVPPRSKRVYAVANRALKPLLALLGSRSIAQFERMRAEQDTS